MAIQDFTAGQILTAAQMDSLQANDYNWTVSTKTASYVLTAADKGTRVVMNAAGATTITVNTSLFDAGDTLFIQNIGAGTCTVTAGTATVTTAGSLALAQWGGGTLYFTSAGAAIFFSGGGTGYGSATGGSSSSITVGGINYTLLTFTSTSTLTVTKAGFFDFLLVSGGMGGVRITTGFAGGGGGAGALTQGSVYLSANQTITIGGGGAVIDQQSGTLSGSASQGFDTTIGSLVGVGAFSCFDLGTTVQPFVFFGGGCGATNTTTIYTPTESFVTGYRGGVGAGANTSAGGGGGNTARGAVAASATAGGAGGAGYDVSSFIGGSALYKAAGGGGGGSTAGGAGGSSVGGAGSTSGTGNSAGANTGSGGGGVYGVYVSGGLGGSGIAYIRFR